MSNNRSIWRTHGVRVVGSPMQRVTGTEEKGVSDATVLTFPRTGAKELSGGAVHLEPGVTTGPQHYGNVETVAVVTRGKLRVRWGEELEFGADADTGDFVFLPPFVPHQQINLSDDEPVEFAIFHSGQESEQVGLDIKPAETFQMMNWEDPNHPMIGRAVLHGIRMDR